MDFSRKTAGGLRAAGESKRSFQGPIGRGEEEPRGVRNGIEDPLSGDW